jgi:hypothetical protein
MAADEYTARDSAQKSDDTAVAPARSNDQRDA